jgi:group I intron endonuclease
VTELSSGIYAIRNAVNGKTYVGQAADIERRWTQHRSNLNCNRHFNQHLQHAWNKYGADAFGFMVIEYCSADQLDEREIHHIAICRSQGDCYNMTDGGGGARGFVPTYETRQKISRSQKGRILGIEHRKKLSESARRRLPATNDTRQKISEANRGKVFSDEHRRRLSEANIGNQNFLGRTHSDEARRKQSEAAKGRVFSDEHRKKLSEANSRRAVSEETKLKLSQSSKGRVFSDETRKKISEARKRYWAEKKAAA